MLPFIKNLFRKKPEHVSVRFDELPAWFHAQSTEYLKSFDGVIQEFYHRMNETKEKLCSANESLLSAPVIDKESVASRVQHIVLGHRSNYVRELGIFLQAISLPQDTSINASVAFAQDVDKQLDLFSQQTKKSFEFARHLFHAEVDGIAEHLQELSLSVREYQQLVTTKNVPLVGQIEKTILQLQSFKKEQDKMRDELLLKHKRSELAERQGKHNDELLQKIMDSDDFLEYQQLLRRREQLQKDVQTAKSNATSFFAQIDRALRKYQHQANVEEQKIIQTFVDDPCAALRADAELHILPVLDALRGQLPSLRVKDTEKVLAALNSNVHQLREGLIDAEHHFEDIRSAAEKHHVIAQLREIEYKRNHFREQEGRLKKEIVILQEKLASITLDKFIGQIEQDVHTTFGVIFKVL